jgi:probable F420-dependent oxidoreductase
VTRPFRFGVQCELAGSRREWQEKARRVEELGFQTFLVPDHFGEQLSPVPALLGAAEATRALRVGTLVFANDFRHPVALAKEVATLDLLCDGRFECGIGAGWMRSEYEQAGLSVDPGATRVARLEEAVALLRALWRGGPVHFAGRHYAVTGLEGTPRPQQSAGPPLLVGGGGPRLLRLAGREADIVGLVPRARADGAGLDLSDLSAASFERKVGWVREGAGARFGALELSTLIQGVAVTGDRAAAAETIARRFGLSAETVLDTPYVLLGSAAEIEERLLALRLRFGVSYYAIFERDLEAFAPIARRLAGR